MQKPIKCTAISALVLALASLTACGGGGGGGKGNGASATPDTPVTPVIQASDILDRYVAAKTTAAFIDAQFAADFIDNPAGSAAGAQPACIDGQGGKTITGANPLMIAGDTTAVS